MLRMRSCVAGLLAALMVMATVHAADATQAELDALKKDIEDLRKKLSSSSSAPAARSSVDKALDSKYGPNSSVTTKAGKLTISGLVQVWYYTIENSHDGLFQDSTVNGISDTGEASDNDSFRVRRTELKFTMDIHENVTAVVMIDPAREATSFPNITDNTAHQGIFKRRNQVASEFDDANDVPGSSTVVSNVQQGSGSVPRLLQDAYIAYHGVIPHHDFQIGQFKPAFGEEGIRSSAQLDFVERSFLGQVGDARDIGVQVHGTWWNDRFQYWVGAFNAPGNYLGSGGQAQNRSDDNDDKDIALRALVRPVWKQETWGSLELGWSSQFGHKGESSSADPVDSPINGLNRNRNWAIRHDAWMSYAPGGPVRGLWLRGEWQWIKDRNAPGSVLDVLGASTGDDGFAQTNGGVTTAQGFYAAIGYKLSDSCFCDCGPGWLKPFEFAARYDKYENVEVADLVNPAHTDNFGTTVYTVGMNYYIKGHNAKIMANYNWVNHPDGESVGANREFANVRSNNFVVSFQVAF